MSCSEKVVLQKILLTFGCRPQLRLWRNNTGTIKTEIGGYISFGLKGSADILGILRGGKFLAIEIKSAKGRQSEDQKNFEEMIESFGGIYILARSVQDVKKRLETEGYL